MIEKGSEKSGPFFFAMETIVLRPTVLSLTILTSTLSACSAQLDAGEETQAASVVGAASLLSADGSKIGVAEITNNNSVVSIAVVVDGLEPGERALHLHSTGVCEAPDFTSAGGHLNPMEREHGSLNPSGQHLGDMPNIVVDENGQSELRFAFADDPDFLAEQIFDADGTAVMIHAGPDDYMSDPAGSAGPRIACGVLEPVLPTD